MTDTPSEGLAQFDALVAGSWRNGGSRGLATTVVRNREPPLLRCRGVCDLDIGGAVGPDTVFAPPAGHRSNMREISSRWSPFPTKLD